MGGAIQARATTGNRADARRRHTPAVPPAAPAPQQSLPPLATVASTSAAFAGLTATSTFLVVLRKHRALGTALRALPRPTTLGLATGAAAGVGLLVLDRLSGGTVNSTRKRFSLEEAGAVLGNWRDPWLGIEAWNVRGRAINRSSQLYGVDGEGPGNAFRHAYAAALLTLRAMRDHGESRSNAAALTRDVGTAHEDRDSTDPDNALRRMDLHNNEAGIDLVGDGHVVQGGRWLRDEELVGRVQQAIAGGKLLVQRDDGTLRATRKSDVRWKRPESDA